MTMINRTNLHVALVIASACAFSAACFAAEPAAEPPMMPGYPNQAAATPTVKLTPHQIRASDAIGSEVRNPDGAVIAKVADLYVNQKDSAVELASLVPDNSPPFKNGRLDALIIDTGGLFEVGLRNRVVGWAKAGVSGGKDGAPLHLAVSKREVDSAPVITTMAPMPVPTESGNTTPMVRRDSTGNISGTRIPVPDTRRGL